MGASWKFWVLTIPASNPFEFEVDEGRIYHWLSAGAQPSESVQKLFKSVGLLERFERFKKGEPVETLLAEAKAYYDKSGWKIVCSGNGDRDNQQWNAG